MLYEVITKNLLNSEAFASKSQQPALSCAGKMKIFCMELGDRPVKNCALAIVDQNVVSYRQPRLPAGLGGEDGAHLGFAHAVTRHDALDLQAFRTIDSYNFV